MVIHDRVVQRQARRGDLGRWHPEDFPSQLVEAAESKLALVDAATSVGDLRIPPGNRLEKLRGDREGHWSVRINRQWRVCFRWEADHAHDVEIVDYH